MAILRKQRRRQPITAAEWALLPGWAKNRTEAKLQPAPATKPEILRLADLRLPICRPCDKLEEAQKTGVFCRCKHGCKSNRWVPFDAACPEGKWGRPVDLATFFDRAVVISLKRTPERLAAFQDRLQAIQWPCAKPELFHAVDGAALPVPAWWKEGGPAWGCLNSHRQVIEQALRDGVKRLLVLEDDAEFTADAGDRLAAFLEAVPADWMCLMIGGQQMNDGFVTATASPLVKRVSQCERTHCYALSAEGMKSLYRWWSEPVSGHCDWRLGDWQAFPEVTCYRPDPIIAIQGGNFSTIRYRQEPARSWDRRVPVAGRSAASVPVAVLDCPRAVLEEAIGAGLVHAGYWRGTDGVDRGLAEHAGDAGYLDTWLAAVRPESAAWPQAIVGIWMPESPLRAEAVRRFGVVTAATSDRLAEFCRGASK